MHSWDKVRQDLSKLLVETLSGTFDLSPRLLTPFEKELAFRQPTNDLQGQVLADDSFGTALLSGRLWYQISELRHAMH